MINFPVSTKKRLALAARFQSLGIKEDELEEHFISSRGPGGQHVNKTSTCVVLRHVPTGLEVRCQRERSQSLNRFIARQLLAEKIDLWINQRESQAAQQREKIRRQKRRRSRRAKEKMLQTKHHQAEKKKSRGAILELE